MNELSLYHKNLNQYISSCSWISISANEIVEYNLRQLPFNFNFTKNFRTFNRYIKFIPILFIISTATFLFTIPFYIQKILTFLVLQRAIPYSEGNSVFFIRNNLSKTRLARLYESSLIDNQTIVLIDDLNGYSSDIKVNQHKLSNYIDINIFGMLYLVVIEIVATSKDFMLNVPNLSINKILFQFIRLPNLILFYSAYDNYLTKQKPKNVSSFEMISRFSSVMSLLSKKKLVNCLGYPHGLEYDIFYPNNYFGDTFYCTSSKAESVLKIRYKKKSSHKFLHCAHIVKALFSYDLNFLSDPKLVYFTDARNPILDYKNIQKFYKIIDLVKLHPSDSKKTYNDLKLQYIENYDAALESKYVMMRPSTVIFEAAISGCLCLCLQTNNLESYLYNFLYPTLSGIDHSINLVSDSAQLINALKK